MNTLDQSTEPETSVRSFDALHDVRLIGTGQTPVGKLPGFGPLQLQGLAIVDACANAGIPLASVDGLIVQDPYSEAYSMFSLAVMEYLGIRAKWTATINVAGSVTIMSAIAHAAWAIASGRCRTCVIAQGENMATSRPPGARGHVLHNRQGGDDFKEPFGALGAPVAYALVAQRFMHERGATTDDFAAVAMQARDHAMRNPNRQTKRPLTIEEYHASQVMADPLRMLDCSLVSDGAGALILTSSEEAARLGCRTARVTGFATNATHCSIVTQPNLDDLGLAAAAQEALGEASIDRGDIDVVILHDAFTFAVPLALEEFGFAPRGEGGALVRSGATAIGGRWPVNPHGGLLSQAHFGGMLHAVEAVQQLCGEAGDRQVTPARQVFWGASGGIFSASGVMILAQG